MKRLLLSLATLALIFSAHDANAQAPPLRITFNLSSQPNPYIAEWQSRRETAIFTVTNSSAAPIDAKITARILVGSDVRAETKFDELTVVTIPARSTRTFYGEDIAPFNSMRFFGGVETSTVRTGQIPAGSYTFCIQLLEPTTRTGLSAEVCRPFTIVNYQAPFLQLPADKSALRQDERPTFRWSSVTPNPKTPVRYRFVVFEVLTGQSSMQAFRGNQPIIDREVIGVTQQLWMPELTEREPGMTYIWTVQALDNDRRPIGDRDGYADPFVFTVARTTVRRGTNVIDTAIAVEGSGTGRRGSQLGGTSSGTERTTSGGGGSGSESRSSGGGSNRQSGGGGDQVINPPPTNAPLITEGLTSGTVASNSPPTTIETPTNPQPPPSTCSTQPAQCTAPSCTPIATQQFGAGDSLTICGFTMMLDSGVTGTNSSLSGTGTIRVKWMGTNVAVTFQNISVNNSNQVCSGTVLATVDSEPDAYPQQWAINVVGSFNWAKTGVKKLNKWLHNKPWKMKALKSVNVDSIFQEQTVIPVTVPLGLNDVSGVTLAITEIKFEPTGAHLNAVAAFPVDLDLNDTLAFKGANFAFGPNAPLVSTGTLGLIEDVNFLGNVNNTQTFEITLKAAHDTAPGTFIRWDCKAFRELALEMEVAYPREWLTPIPDNGQRVRTKILTNVMSWKDWLVMASLPRCHVTNSNGLELEVISMAYDHSDTRNATGMVFPTNYTGDQSVAFQGFYLKSTSVVLPDKLRTFPNPASAVKITIADMVINKLGITCDVVGKNIVNFPNQNVAGLGASIDTIKVSMINSSITSAYMRGKVTIPLFKPVATNAILYKAMFNTANGFQFTLSPSSPMESDVFGLGHLTIENTSSFSIKLASGPAQYDMNINAKFSFNDIKIGNKVKVSMKDLSVQGMKIGHVSNAPMTFAIGTWSFASPPKWLAKIPLTIDKIEFAMKTKQGNEVLRGALAFDVKLSLSENKIAGRTRLEVEGAIEKPPNDKYMPKFISVKVKEIEIHATLAAVKIDGYANFYNDDPTYGDGFSGSLKAVFNSMQLQVDVSARFGSTEYGSPGNPYRYWGVEAKVILPKPGIPFLPGVAFYGFGAGAWQRMNVTNMTKPSVTAVANANDTTKLTATGATFTPNASNGFGFKVLAVVGTSPEPKTFNADASLMGEFSTTGGMTKIEFLMECWIAAALLERDKAPVWGTVSVSYVPPTKEFNLNASVNVMVPRTGGSPGNVMKTEAQTGGPITLKFFINGMTGKWAFKLGEYSQPNTLRLFNMFNVQEYLMFGNNITPAPGFLPTTIAGLNQAGVGVGFQSQPTSPQASKGQGFSAGITVNANNPERTIDITNRVKVKYQTSTGFEINLSMLRYPPTAMCNGVPLGMNGWYAQGGVALWFWGNAYLYVGPSEKKPYCWCAGDDNKPNRCRDPFNCCMLWCGSLTQHITTISLGARLNAGFPNPTWMRGQANVQWNVFGGTISGNMNVSVDVGTECTLPAPEPVPGIPAEDAVANIEKDGTLIHNINPISGSTGYPPDNSIGVSLGFTPDEAFEVFERQANDSLVRRTFQARYRAKLDSLGVASSAVTGEPNSNASSERSMPPGGGAGGPSEGGSSSGRSVRGSTRGGVASSPSGPPTVIVLTRSSMRSALGEYDYRIYRAGPTASNQWRQNMHDNTRYRFEVIGELWEKIGANWVRATKRNGQQISETRTSNFSTGVSPRINPTPTNMGNN